MRVNSSSSWEGTEAKRVSSDASRWRWSTFASPEVSRKDSLQSAPEGARHALQQANQIEICGASLSHRWSCGTNCCPVERPIAPHIFLTLLLALLCTLIRETGAVDVCVKSGTILSPIFAAEDWENWVYLDYWQTFVYVSYGRARKIFQTSGKVKNWVPGDFSANLIESIKQLLIAYVFTCLVLMR